MPVHSLTQSVLRWPKPEQVLAEAQAWAHTQQQAHPSLRRVGVFGSYGRGTASVGSDLDQRLRAWPIEQLPLSCDALVLTSAELDQLLASDARMALELRRDLRWLDELPGR